MKSQSFITRVACTLVCIFAATGCSRAPSEQELARQNFRETVALLKTKCDRSSCAEFKQALDLVESKFIANQSLLSSQSNVFLKLKTHGKLALTVWTYEREGHDYMPLDGSMTNLIVDFHPDGRRQLSNLFAVYLTDVGTARRMRETNSAFLARYYVTYFLSVVSQCSSELLE